MIPFFGHRLLSAGVGGGLSGYDTTYGIINSSSQTTTYSGTFNNVDDGDLVLVHVNFLGNNNSIDISAATVTLGGNPMTFAVGNPTVTTVVPACGIFYMQNPGTGNLTLSCTLPVSVRALAAAGTLITGHDTSTPIVGSSQSSNLNQNVTDYSLPVDRVPSAAGNVIITNYAIKGGGASGFAATSPSTLSLNGATGSNNFSDLSWAVVQYLAPDTSAVTNELTWSGANRAAASFVEIAAA